MNASYEDDDHDLKTVFYTCTRACGKIKHWPSLYETLPYSFSFQGNLDLSEASDTTTVSCSCLFILMVDSASCRFIIIG